MRCGASSGGRARCVADTKSELKPKAAIGLGAADLASEARAIYRLRNSDAGSEASVQHRMSGWQIILARASTLRSGWLLIILAVVIGPGVIFFALAGIDLPDVLGRNEDISTAARMRSIFTFACYTVAGSAATFFWYKLMFSLAVRGHYSPQ